MNTIELKQFDLNVDVFDPHVDEEQVYGEYKLKVVSKLVKIKYF
jgi:hypothetical protein